APVLGGDSLTAYALLVQPDGRILLSGYFNGPNGATLRLARFNPDGQWDSTFNPGSGPDNYVVCLALQTDGHLLIGGGFTSVNGVPRSHMARLINELTAPPVPTLTSAYVTSWAGSNATFEVSMVGLPPFSFQWQFTGTNLPGRTALPLQLTNLLAADAGLYTLVVSNASGTVTSAPVRLTVLTATARPGTLDSTFHPGGGGSEGIVFSLAEQPDGKVFVGGYFSTFDGEPHGGLVRLYPDGSVDTNFTASGYVGQGAVTWVLLQPDGKLVVRGWFTNFNGVSVTNLVRLDPNGSLDPSFTASINMTDACGGLGTAVPMPMALQPDGKIVIGGPFGEVNGVAVTNLVRLDPDGSIDPGFTTSFSAAYCTAAIALQPDGRMLTGGAGGVTRLETNGVSDASFNAGPIGWVVAIVLQPDGKIVIGGGFQMVHGVPRVNLARLNPDGTLDETFVPPVSDWLANSQVNTLVLQPDGKLVAGLWTTEAPGVARFNPDGSLDSSFHRGYCTSFAFLGGILSMIRLANGQILVGGDLSYYDSIPVAQIARLHGDEAISGLLPFSIGTRWNAGVFELGLFGEAGRTYTIEASTGLPAFSVWTNLISSGTNWLADPESPASPQRFYRARTTN
ncbi:MAG: hypothetical protein NT154_27405, partial [Verrucomicrobia bacterium]|nr:hypothetical protein [Verrucomicrobiota bacterium]